MQIIHHSCLFSTGRWKHKAMELKMRGMMVFFGRAAAMAALVLGMMLAAGAPARADNSQYTMQEIVDAGHGFFGSTTGGLAKVIEAAFKQYGLPNGYILGQEAAGSLVLGATYGEGDLYTKNAGDRRVFWEGPSIGFDTGGEGARTMMLVYNLPETDAVYQRFAGVDGSAYFIGGFGMTALTANNVVLVPIRSGVGFRLGANIGYLKFTPKATWNPF
jgi:hypothetical protein